MTTTHADADVPWLRWLNSIIGTDTLTDAARLAGLDKSTVSRWRTGRTPSPEGIVQLARVYNADPLEGLVAIGLLTPEEARTSPTTTADVLARATPEALTAELLARINRANTAEA